MGQPGQEAHALSLAVPAVPVAAAAGLWLCTSCQNEALVKKIDETKKVTASADGPTADA